MSAQKRWKLVLIGEWGKEPRGASWEGRAGRTFTVEGSHGHYLFFWGQAGCNAKSQGTRAKLVSSGCISRQPIDHLHSTDGLLNC